MDRKFNILILSIAVMAMFASCKEVDPLAGTELGEMGIQSVTAAFTGEVYENDINAKFSALPDADGNIVVEVPYYYPQTSDNEVPEEFLTNMRVTASLFAGTYIEPALGVLDMSKTYDITAYDAAGRTKEYTLTAKITKLKECELTAFNVTSAGSLYSGIINPGAKTISLMVTGDELTGCTVDYTVSPHATVSGNLETIMPGDKITVTAHNEVDKNEYTIAFAVPEKIGYGARVGSGKNLWTKYFSNLDVTLSSADAPMRLAAHGDVLYVLAGGSTIYTLNKATGEYLGTLAIPDGYTVNSIVSDEAGNILFAADSESGTDFKVYAMESIDATPVELISYSNTIANETRLDSDPANDSDELPVLGNIRVTGDINTSAVVTANASATLAGGVVWQITDGMADAGYYVHNTAATPLGNAYNGAIVGAASNKSTGVFAFGYWGVYNLYYSKDLTSFTDAVVMTETGSNENNNCLSTVTFNGAQYIAAGIGAHFSWGYVPQFHVYDSTNPNMLAQFFVAPWSELDDGGFKGVTGATSDVLIVVSEDGYYMDVYFVDANYDLITCYEFDCIQQ